MNTFDRLLNIKHTADLAHTRKQNEFLMQSALLQNQQLLALQKEIASANATNQELLQKKIAEEQYQAEQRFFKHFLFSLEEILEEYLKIKSPVTKGASFDILQNFQQYTEMAIDRLNDFSDKKEAKVLLQKLNTVLDSAKSNISIFEKSSLQTAMLKLDHYEETKIELNSLQKPKNTVLPTLLPEGHTSMDKLIMATPFFVALSGLTSKDHEFNLAYDLGLFFFILIIFSPLVFFAYKYLPKKRKKTNEFFLKSYEEAKIKFEGELESYNAKILKLTPIVEDYERLMVNLENEFPDYFAFSEFCSKKLELSIAKLQ